MSIFDRIAKSRMDQVFNAIFLERARQEQLKADGRFQFTCADADMELSAKGLVLGEEFGEVCRAVLGYDKLVYDHERPVYLGDIRKELVQVAAVAVAWIESIDQIKADTTHVEGA